MPRFLVTLILGSLLLSGSAFCADPLSIGLFPYGVRFPDGTGQTTAALPSLPANMAWVAHAGGRYTSPLDAMNHLRDWCHADSILAPAISRCTLLIAPGVYELGADQLVMQAGVDIVGMGVRTTVLSGVVDNTALDGASALIRGAERTTLRGLTVINSGKGSFSAVIFSSENSFSVEQVEVIASGLAVKNYGIVIDSPQPQYTVSISDIAVSVIQEGLSNTSECYGIWHKGAGSVEISRAKVVVSGCDDNLAIKKVHVGKLRLINVDAKATSTGTHTAAALWNSYDELTVLDSKLEGTTYSLGIGSTSARIINTQLDGPVGANSAGTQCWGTYDSNLADRGC